MLYCKYKVAGGFIMRIIHFFNWRLNDIVPNLETVKKQGFDAIQLNPIQPLKEDGLKEWWMSYQPISFDVGNYFGSKEELEYLCYVCKELGILPFQDVVINHMGSSVNDNFEPHERVDEKLRSNPDYWRIKESVNNWNNRDEVIHNCINLPGLNVYNQDVEDMIVDFLNSLIDLGIEGFRFDAAKSIGLPSEGYRFWPNIIYRLKKYGLFLYGEVIFEENRNILDEYARYMHVLGNYDTSNPDSMVKFVESHDSFLSDDRMGYTKYTKDQDIIANYKSLVNYYNNTLFYVRPFNDTWKSEEIKAANFTRKIK